MGGKEKHFHSCLHDFFNRMNVNGIKYSHYSCVETKKLDGRLKKNYKQKIPLLPSNILIISRLFFLFLLLFFFLTTSFPFIHCMNNRRSKEYS